MKQKDAVVKEVKDMLGTSFVPNSTVALTALSAGQLETIKINIGDQILAGTIDYSKDKTNVAEVRSYARSMVMNHLKKAKELNGNADRGMPNGAAPRPKKISKNDLNPTTLPEYLKEFVESTLNE